MGYGMMNYGMYGGGSIFTMFFHLIFWVLLIAGVYFAIRWVTTNGPVLRGQSGNEENPLDIVKKRYAKGEISREDFEQIKRDLT